MLYNRIRKPKLGQKLHADTIIRHSDSCSWTKAPIRPRDTNTYNIKHMVYYLYKYGLDQQVLLGSINNCRGEGVGLMELSSFSALDRNCMEYLRIMIGEKEENLPEVEKSIFFRFAEAYDTKQIVFLDGYGSTNTNELDAIIATFFTGYENKYGEEVWGRFERNKHGGTRWWGIFFDDKTHLMKRLMPSSFFIGKMVFSPFPRGLEFLKRLGEEAIPEKWTYASHQSGIVNPILKSYLENMLDRLEYEEKVVFEGNQMVFNTGLINRFYKEIYIICDVDNQSNPHFPCYVNPRFCSETADVFRDTFSKKPEIASFFSRIEEVIFDSRLEIDLQDAHIFIDNRDRVGENLRSLGLLDESQIQMLFEKGVDNALVLAKRNYKLVVPQYWRKTKDIQFLMPIYLSREFQKPDGALVLEKRNNRYKGTTVLTLDMAYQNARLIANPESFWLDPRNI